MKTAFACLWAIVTLHATSALATFDAINFSGFGTVGAITRSHEGVQFFRNGTEAPSTSSVVFSPDSVLGIQSNIRIAHNIEGVVQLVARETPANTYVPRPSLAFLSITPTPALTLRAGRLRIPLFMLSDSLDINYAHPWVRPPIEVYGLAPFSDLDGIDLLYRSVLDDTYIEVHPYFGRSQLDIYKRGEASLSQAIGTNIAISRGPLTLHLGYARARMDIRWGDPDFERLKQALVTVPLASADILSQMEGDDATASFVSAGFQWDDNRWLMIGEYAARRASDFVNSAHGWQLTVGHHLGPTTPYLRIARAHQDSPVVTDVPGGTLNPFYEAVGVFNATRNGSQRTLAAGLRWDLRDDTAFKVEIAQSRVPQGAWGSFFPTVDAATFHVNNRTVNTLSVSVDVVF